MENSLKLLTALVPPPAIATDVDRPELLNDRQKELGIAFPADYLALVHQYGSGYFRTRSSPRASILGVFNPMWDGYVRFVRDRLEAYREWKAAANQAEFIYNLYPEVPGLFPWGKGDSYRAFFWLVEGGPNDWPVVFMAPDESLHRFDLPVIRFLVKLFSGDVDVFGGQKGSQWFKEHADDFEFVPDPPRPAVRSLHDAILCGDKTQVLDLLPAGADIMAVDSRGNSPLFCAIEQLDIDTTKLLLERGIDPNKLNANGDTPLITAVTTAGTSPAMLRLLLGAGADVDGRDSNGRTPLMWACRYDNTEVIQELLQRGANPNAKSNEGKTPLYIARKRDEIKKLLRDAGAHD